jgi:hypothetical protein
MNIGTHYLKIKKGKEDECTSSNRKSQAEISK